MENQHDMWHCKYDYSRDVLEHIFVGTILPGKYPVKKKQKIFNVKLTD